MSRAAVHLLPLTGGIQRNACGGKAANLSRLAAMGLTIPAGFAIPGGAYLLHLQHAGIADECSTLLRDLPGLDAAALSRRAALLRQAIRETEIEPGLRSALREACREGGWHWPVAVRSSAVAEDAAGASFAGQLDSVLNVTSAEELEQAVRAVWASVWSERCLRYAQHAGVAPGAVGVVVQRQVDARFSGVMFTRDPLGQHDGAVIEFVDGLGDVLVSGQVTPARAIVRYPGMHIDCDADVPQGLAGTFAQLAGIGRELERRFGAAQDVEWCQDAAGLLWLLQSRPAKVVPQGRRITWSNANIAENFPDPVTPFLFSIVSRGYTAYFRNLGLGFGISRRRIDAMAPDLERLVGLHAGRLYYNLSAIHAALRLAPGGPRLAEWFNQFTGAEEYPFTQQVSPGPFARAAEWCRVALYAAWQYLFVGRRVTAFEDRADCYAANTHPQKLGGRPLPDLKADIDAFLEIRLRRWNDAALADAAAMVCYGLLKKYLSALDKDGSATLQHNLLKGLPDLASARPVTELWALTHDLRLDARLAAVFTSLPADEIAVLLRQPEHAAFGQKFERYLGLWGFRYSRELMLTSPTPQEDPVPMIRILQSYMRDSGPGPEAVAAEQASARVAATRQLEERLSPLSWMRVLPFSAAGRFRLLLHATQGAIRLRERARMKQALLYTRLRHVLLHAGEALANQGRLERGDDVFFLHVDEVLGLLAGCNAVDDLSARIAQRRVAFAACAALQPPDSLHLPDGETWQPASIEAKGDAAGEKSSRLRGVIACGGCFEGTAAVIEDVAEIDKIRNGDVLVTRQTDPGWAAVFFMVKGLVIERGGMLSHGAIIAREYGIPAVVGVPDAMKRIRSGERIRVNGDQGVVELDL